MENQTMMQAFEWYVPADQKHWQRLASVAAELKAIGVDNMWIPPGCKAASPQGNGYDIYDLYDLGEFEQKGTRATKWGTKEDLVHLTNKAEEAGVGIFWDAVLNHKAAADHTEVFRAVEVDPKDRTKDITVPREIEAWVGFDFPGRQGRYSSMKYHWYHFTGTDYNATNGKSAIYRIAEPGKGWSRDVTTELGNYDYLMFADVDHSDPEVEADIMAWVVWLGRELKISGMRFDAVKHFSRNFLRRLIKHIDRTVGPRWFLVAEYWRDSLEELTTYLQRMDYMFSLFDVPLCENFGRLTRESDLRKVFDNTLVKHEPANAVTFVMNHDTQPLQSLETPVEPFVKPLAYALILLRNAGYPCVFYGDLYGMQGDLPSGPACQGKLPDLCLSRKLYAYGEQLDYFDHPHCVGWTRLGTRDRPYGLACVMSNRRHNKKMMFVGERHRGEVWTDLLEWHPSKVTIDGSGFGLFPCRGHSVSIWVNVDAEGRDRFGRFDADIYKTGLSKWPRLNQLTSHFFHRNP